MSSKKSESHERLWGLNKSTVFTDSESVADDLF